MLSPSDPAQRFFGTGPTATGAPGGPRSRQTGGVLPRSIERRIAWVLLALWVGVLWFGDASIGSATDGDVAGVARIAGGVVWLVGVAALAVPAVVTLTVARAVVPIAVPAAIVTWAGGADPVDAIPFLAVALLATLVAGSAEVGRAFVQASAYGDEDRYLLRPPLAYLLASALTWAVWVACVLAGPLLLADERWVLGGVLTALAVALTVWAVPRWHRLARRWFVLVPVGVVVHDHLVLAETLMLRRQELRGLHLAPVGTDALDLTGPASGHAVEVVTHEPATAILAATPAEPRGKVVHLTGCLVSPSRPGRLLAAASARRLPVG